MDVKLNYVECVECGSSIYSTLAIKMNGELFCSRKCVKQSEQSRKRLAYANFKGYYPE